MFFILFLIGLALFVPTVFAWVWSALGIIVPVAIVALIAAWLAGE